MSNTVTWTNIPMPTPVLGVGWSLGSRSGLFNHTAGNSGHLSFPYQFKSGCAYRFIFDVSSQIPIWRNEEKRFGLFLARSSTGKDKYVKGNFYGQETTVVLITDPGNNYSYLNVVPDPNWNGAAIFHEIAETIVQVSEISKEEYGSIFLGGGGRVSTGISNVANGLNSLWSNTTGESNTANGSGALSGNTTGSRNTANGSGALIFNTAGSGNTANGAAALSSNTTGGDNVANGCEALAANTSGGFNTANGVRALVCNTVGENNTANGRFALYYNTTGSYNTASGSNALEGRIGTTGHYNTASGYRALGGGGGSYNTAMGAQALLCNRSGLYNVAVGSDAGIYLNTYAGQMTVNNSVYIGSNTKGCTEDNQTNQVVIGHEAVGHGSNTITLGNSDITHLYCNTTAITALSDRRIKEEIEEANLDLCVDAVKSLPVSRYKYKNFVGTHIDKHVTGFLADDVENVFPKSVSKRDKCFPVLDEEGCPVYEEVTETVTELDKNGKEITKETKREVQKMFLMKDVKDITMTEALPTLWGAVQSLIRRVEQLENT